MGFEKLVNEFDGKTAAAVAEHFTFRPLTVPVIEKFLEDFGEHLVLVVPYMYGNPGMRLLPCALLTMPAPSLLAYALSWMTVIV